MSASAALRDILRDGGTKAETRVYRDERPQGSLLPAVRLQTVSDDRPVTYEGRVALRETEIQVDCMAKNRGDADALAEQAITLAEAGGTKGDVRIVRSFVSSSRSYADRDDAQNQTFVTSLDFRVWHQPAE